MAVFMLLFSIPLVGAAQTPEDVRGSAPADSIAAWTEVLRTGTLEEKARVAGKLSHQDAGRLPAATGEAAVAELERLHEILLEHRIPPNRDRLGREGYGEYYMAVATLVAKFDSPEADRALILSIGMSIGLQQRAAELGDEAVPTLVEMLRKDLSAPDAIETLALAWFWADSTGAPLSEESRSTILREILAASRSDDFSYRLGAASAFRYTKDSAFLPLVRAFEARERSDGRAVIANVLQDMAVDSLQQRADAAPVEQLAERTRRVLRLLCANVTRGARSGARRSLENEFDAALDHLRAGRTRPAENGFVAVIRRANQAFRTGAISEDEHTLITGGARMVLDRL